MLSIIISSYQPHYFEQVSRSIETTIGNIPYEIIQIWNPNLMGICEAYNKGAAKAKFPMLCFVHEDVEFITKDWGQRVYNYFEENEELGALGVAGGVKTQMVTGWGSGISGWDHAHLFHSEHPVNTFSDESVEVNALDGLIIFTPQKVWNEVRFDESVSGFHFYDIDYTFRVSKNYKVLVVNFLLLKHYSSGKFAKDWINAAIRYHRKKKIFDNVPLDKCQKSQIRKFYYSFSQPGMYDMCFYYRLKYIFALGVDKDSLKPAVIFLFIRYWHKFRCFVKNIKDGISCYSPI
jgi:hypothetical protein